jgi:hypothetical protein
MKSAALEQPTQVDMGFSSMVNMLAQMGKEERQQSGVLGSILERATEIKVSVTDAFKSFSFDRTQKFNVYQNIQTAQHKTNNWLEALFIELLSIRKHVVGIESGQEGMKPKAEKMQSGRPLDYTETFKKSNDHLSAISANTKSALKFLEGIANGKKVEAPKAGHKVGEEEDEGFHDTKKKVKGFFNVAEFAKSIAILNANITKKMISGLGAFEKAYASLLEMPEKKMKTFTDGTTKFGSVMEKLSKQIKPAAITIGVLSAAFVALSLSVTNPIFIVGMATIGLFVTLVKRYGGDKDADRGMLKFAEGIGILTLAMGLMRFVQWESGAKMLVFIAGLGLAMKLYMKPAETSGMFKFAMGIGILTVAMALMNFVDWSSGAKMLIFIGGLGLALRTFSGSGANGGLGKQLLAFGEGLGIMVLALVAFNYINFTSVLKMITFVAGLGLALKLFGEDKGGLKSPLLSFAFGIGLMVLGLLAFAEIPLTAIMKMLTFIGLLGLELKLFSNGDGKSPMLQFAMGLGIMVLAMYAMNELPWEALGKTLLFLGGLGLVMKLFEGGSGADFLMMAGGILVIAGALWVFKKIGWTMADALILGGTITILGVIVAAAGALAEVIVPGAISMVAMGVSLALFALSLWAISKLTIDYESIAKFGVAALGLTTMMALIAPLAALGAIGAVLFLPIAAAALLGAGSLMLISKVRNYDTKNFADAVFDLTWGFTKIAPFAALGVIGATLFLPIAASALLGAAALKAISLLAFDQKAITAYGVGVNSLIGALDNLGIIQVTRTAAKSVLLLPIFAAATLGALALKAMSEMDLNEGKVNLAAKLIDSFSSSMIYTILRNKDRFEKAMPGINALAKLMGISSDVAKAIGMMANMEFVEHGVRNGKLYIKSVRKLNPADMKRVGENLAVMLQCLIEPLTILGSDTATFNIGGRKIANPFKNPSALKGIDMLSRVGGAFKPLMDSISEYANLPLASDPKKLQLFTQSLMSVINTIIWAIDRAATIKQDIASKSITTISRFVSSMKDLNVDRFNGINSAVEKFLGNLADDVKWKKIASNMNMLQQQFKGIASSINSIDMGKATMFEKNVRNLLDKNAGENLTLVVQELKELFGLVSGQYKAQADAAQAPARDDKKDNSISFGFNNGPQDKKAAKAVGKPTEHEEMTELMNQIGMALAAIVQQLTGVNDKLAGKLKVVTTTGTANSFLP